MVTGRLWAGCTLSPSGSGSWTRRDRMTIGVTEARLALLRSLPLFEGVGEEELHVVAALLDDIEIETGEVLTTEGRIGCEAFVIVVGAAAVWVEGRHVATLERGALIGEKA